MLHTLLAQLVQWSTPWHDLYADSGFMETAVTSMHLVAILVGGGIAVAADRSTLRASHGTERDRSSMLGELHAVHRPVLVGLAVLFLSGLAMTLADLSTFLGSPIFFVKLGLVTALCLNGAFLYRTEMLLRREPTAHRWRRLRFATWLSLSLWIGTVVAGATLVNAA